MTEAQTRKLAKKRAAMGMKKMRKYLMMDRIIKGGSQPKNDVVFQLYLKARRITQEGTVKEFINKLMDDPTSDLYDKRTILPNAKKPRQRTLFDRECTFTPKPEFNKSAAYDAYLKSKKWRDFRRRILDDRANMCESCNSLGTEPGVVLHIHHLTYKRLYNELPEDVKILCHLCHEKTHGRKFLKKKPLVSKSSIEVK